MPIKDLLKRREHHKKYMREIWYPRNKKRHILLIKAGQRRLFNEVRKLKSRPCMDCGGSFHPESMDFDHVHGAKGGNISTLCSGGYRKKAMEEISKCEIVCANCHRIRTYNRRHQPLLPTTNTSHH